MGKKLSVLIIALVAFSMIAGAQNVTPAADNSTLAPAVTAAPDAPQAPSTTSPAKAPKEKRINADTEFKPFGVGVGFTLSSLGFGGQVGVSLTKKTNARFGFNAFNFSRDFDKDGIAYNGTLGLKSMEGLLDFFPFGGGFHVSGGAMLYNGNELTAKANVTAGNSFTLNNVDYYSGATDPIKGTGKLAFNKFAPEFLFGFGNLVPRTKHISISFEAGMAYHGSPKATLNLSGTACDTPTGGNCRTIASDPTIQSNIVAQQNKLNNDASFFKMWPIIRLGFGYRF